MRKLITILSLSTLVIAGCGAGETEKGEQTGTASNDSSVPTAQVARMGDTLVVRERMAVFYLADSAKLEKLKAQMGEDDFYTVADDAMFYTSSAFDFLDSVKLPNINTGESKYLKFVKSDGSYELIGLDTLSDPWTVYFFDPAQRSMPVRLPAIQEDYERYFK